MNVVNRRHVACRHVEQDWLVITYIGLSHVVYIQDPTYLETVTKFAKNQGSLDMAFSNAWYKLTTRDMGSVIRCAGPDVPPAQEFQMPLPEASAYRASSEIYKEVERSINEIMHTDHPSIPPKVFSGQPSYSGLFTTPAFQCMPTFPSTDYFGGCNGARIRLSPEKYWSANSGMMQVEYTKARAGSPTA